MAQIRLKNFRKFATLDGLGLDNINLLVGKNNAGKSTLVKAIMLLLDNLSSLNWTNIKSDYGMLAMHNAPKPMFRFDANGIHNLHIGTFDRAKCNYNDDNRIVIGLEYEDFDFEITISKVMDGAQETMPIEKIVISRHNKYSFAFDFNKYTMSFSSNEKRDQNQIDNDVEAIERLANDVTLLEKEINKAIEKSDVVRIAELKQEQEKLEMRKTALLGNIEKQVDSSQSATFDLTYYHENAGENILVQYIRTFVRIADLPIVKKGDLGELANTKNIIVEDEEIYNEESEKQQFISEHIGIIRIFASELETLLNNINVDYIQAHTATQKLILSADDKQDVNSKVVDEYYKEFIQTGRKTDRFVKSWLKNFEIGKDIIIKPLEGEGYYVKVKTEDGFVHLADMGMGSIQLIILILRLATIGNRSEKTNRPWWIIIEEPEQNLHPKLQSKLVELFFDFIQTYCDPYMHTLIVETHSEYMIRRSQLKVAQLIEDGIPKEFCYFKVFYFPSENGRQPYDMEYQTNGLFAKKFDSGFFDEAGRMHMEILKNSNRR